MTGVYLVGTLGVTNNEEDTMAQETRLVLVKETRLGQAKQDSDEQAESIYVHERWYESELGVTAVERIVTSERAAELRGLGFEVEYAGSHNSLKAYHTHYKHTVYFSFRML